MIVAIDGPAGSGKSTAARLAAKELGLRYMDTGAMYRAGTLKAMRAGVNLEDEDALVRLLRQTTIELKQDGDVLRTFLDGQDVSAEIRAPEVTRNVFYLARAPKVREWMVALQQRMGAQGGVVAEGRDATTVIFPNATHKIYMDARLDVRAQRRLKDWADRHPRPTLAEVQAELQERDQKDFSRTVGPLRRVPEALYLDTSDMTIEQVVARVVQFVREGK